MDRDDDVLYIPQSSQASDWTLPKPAEGKPCQRILPESEYLAVARPAQPKKGHLKIGRLRLDIAKI